MTKTTITPELLRNALSFVPSNLPRDEWARVGMAIKSEYPDDTGLQLFSDWSASGGGTFDVGAARSTWRSIREGGGVGVSTLLYLAKQHGFKLPRQGGAAHKPSAAELQQQAEQRGQRQQAQIAEAARMQADHEAAAGEAVALWENASDTGESLYLQRKGVQGIGVRYTADGWLLVPVRDGVGRLWNVQRIAPAAAANGGQSKLFLKGGRKSGLWHVLGRLDGASLVLIAEGYATAASLHMGTGLPVAVAFDAGNLLGIAKALRQLLPAAALVVCGDDDAATQERTGRNPGRMKAEAAARAVKGRRSFPLRCPREPATSTTCTKPTAWMLCKGACCRPLQGRRQRRPKPAKRRAKRQISTIRATLLTLVAGLRGVPAVRAAAVTAMVAKAGARAAQAARVM